MKWMSHEKKKEVRDGDTERLTKQPKPSHSVDRNRTAPTERP